MQYYIRKFDYTPAPKVNIESFIKDAEKFLRDPFSKEQSPKYPLTNIGYKHKNLVFEIALAGFKKQKIKVSYVGNVITVNAEWVEEESNIKYIQKNICSKDVCRKFYLSNEYLGSTIKWKFVDGFLTIVVSPSENTNIVAPSDDDESLFENEETSDTNENTGSVSEETSEEEETNED